MTMPIPKTPEIDEKRKAMIEAARAYDELQRELTSLRDQLHTAVAGLEAKNSEITELKKMLADSRSEWHQLLIEERANVDIANKARDQSYAERADALAWLSAVEAVIARAVAGGALQPIKWNGGISVFAGGPGGGGAAAGSPGVGTLPYSTSAGDDLFKVDTGSGGSVPDAGGGAA